MVNVPSLSYAVVKESTAICITVGAKTFSKLEKKRLAGDSVHEANSEEVVDLRKENTNLKQAVAELYLRNDWLKKSLTGQGVILDDD